MNKSCMDERNILSNKSKYRKKIILFHLLIFADSGWKSARIVYFKKIYKIYMLKFVSELDWK